MKLAQLLGRNPFDTPQEEKNRLFSEVMTELTEFHSANCPEYRKLIHLFQADKQGQFTEETVPFFPVTLFKYFNLKSVAQEDVYRVLHSSGTTGQTVSSISLDRDTADAQQQVLFRLAADFVGDTRMPFLVLDTRKTLKSRAEFSARAAGILGFSMFASRTCFALDDDMKLNLERVQEFLRKYQGEPVLLFGFTYVIWEFVLCQLRAMGTRLNIPGGYLIHGGGWKKLKDHAVPPQQFRQNVQELLGVRQVSNYYGMAEQTGSIYFECNCGHLHAGLWSDVLMRRPGDFGICQKGEPGLIQVLSVLPRSYPGHSLLTEDIGVLLGEDDCPCGRLGRYFSVIGRTPQSEMRGCSDTDER